MRWGATPIGKLFTSTKSWSLSLADGQFVLMVDGRGHAGSVLLLEKLAIHPGIFWSAVRFEGAAGQTMALDGIRNGAANQMQRAITKAIEHQHHIASLINQFNLAVDRVRVWAADATEACRNQFRTRGWLSHEFKSQVDSAKPQVLDNLLEIPEIGQHLATLDKQTQAAVKLWKQSFHAVADALNMRHQERALVESRSFFDRVEKSPLTKEQAEAVICFDNRVQLVASAGSGKTSTMVAKAGYALERKYFAADRMLLLAFNTDAAAELRKRIKQRLEPLGLPADQIVAQTFHAFGLDVIGAATGKKPSLAPWVETGRDQEALLQMVDELKDQDPQFRRSWDMFRLVFGQDLPKFGKEEENPEAWDRASGRNGFWTLKGDVVKSRGELVIANWFFYNGVDYVYEGSYKIDLADSKHRQYRPDFYLPEADVYLEHWAIDAKGEPPTEFVGYKEGMAWKKHIHAEHKTKLLETTMADLWTGKAFAYLEWELTLLGVKLDPNPDRVAPGRQPIESPRLVRTIRSFLTHVKSNRLSVRGLRARLEVGVAGQFRFRHEMFLDIFEKLWELWESRLRAERCIDFEDMLNMAADCLEQGRWNSPYELVMVDEFQDASQARARLVSALINKPGRHLFAVGDDWQSINRFTGADLAVMTDFEAKFGKAVTLKLETTFRCPQSLCDISSQFVLKNPKQLRKRVRSSTKDVENSVRIVCVSEEARILWAVEARVAEIASTHPGGQKRIKVYILGRYKKDEAYKPQRFDASKVDVEFITVHSSKGLEADHVILPRITSETLGFPSRVIDDPVLQLAMPGGDGFEFAEERRLFYVALTRARQTVMLVTVASKESGFISELVRDHKLKVLNVDGSESANEICPKCEEGFMLLKSGRNGPFIGCSNFPRCKHSRKVASNNQGQRRGR